MDSMIINNFMKEGDLTAYDSIILMVLFLWSIIWKGISLWHASQKQEKTWFVALLLLNTAGILEIIYLFHFSKRKFTTQQTIQFLKSLNLKKIKQLIAT